MDTLELQYIIEKKAFDYSYDRLVREISKRVDNGQAHELKEGQIILLHSIDLVAMKLKQYFKLNTLRGETKALRDSLKLEFEGEEQTLAYIVISAIVSVVSNAAIIPATGVVKAINTRLYEAIQVRRVEGLSKLDNFVDDKYKESKRNRREKIKRRLASKYNLLADTDLSKANLQIGTALLDAVMKSGANIIEPKMVKKGKRTVLHLTYTDECYNMILQSRKQLLAVYQKCPILVHPPKDYTSFDGSGGYYSEQYYKIPIVKAYGKNREYLREYFKKADVKNIYSIVNTLQQTPWRVNKNVYEVMSTIFNENITDPESTRTNPFLIGGIAFNEHLEARDIISPYDYGEIHKEGKYKGLPVDKTQMRRYFDDLDQMETQILSIRGKALMLGLVLSNAKEYLGYDKFYFSYQYDFRGRMYPIQQHLQPQGDGKVKALLEFAEGVPITTEKELFWFLVHGANCYGFDKDEYEDRVAKIKEKEEEIRLIVSNPYKYSVYWKDTDDPFLYLAWCYEYVGYLEDPEGFLSHIPIALDATCSGIQIYSGLLKDKEGAEAVNVIGNKREDIYQRVADKGEEYLAQGKYPKELRYKTSDGVEHTISTVREHLELKGNISRKLTKRNTMTQPYSVTFQGMYQQLKDELKGLTIAGKKFWSGEDWVVAKVLANLNDRAITSVVKGAKVGQAYLKDLTKDLVKRGKFVFYTTYLGFPVLQRINKTKIDRIHTPIGKLQVRSTLEDLHPLKMTNGIAPNFIHSLDGGGGLMGLTIIKLSELGCTRFHLIHDQYGVPVDQVENLNKAVREAFVELFKSNPLEKFVMQVNPDYEVLPEEIMINTLDLNDVFESRYIFS